MVEQLIKIIIVQGIMGLILNFWLKEGKCRS